MLIIRWNASNNSGLHCGWTEIIEERTKPRSGREKERGRDALARRKQLDRHSFSRLL